MRKFVFSCLAVVLMTAGLAAHCRAQEPTTLPPLAGAVVGGEFDYTVKRGDMLLLIGARLGVDAHTIAALNRIDYDSIIYPGQKLRIDNRHIVPVEPREGIVLNIPQRMLFFFKQGSLFGRYPIAVGRPSWPTPRGPFSVLEMRKNPVWRVPRSIQEEMRREGLVVRTRVPPGPDNPLGEHWLGLSIRGYGIHGTNAPVSIYTFGTHGCIRLSPEDAKELYENVKLGEPGAIIYQPYLLAKLPDGRVFLEIHRDIYRKRGSAFEVIKLIAGSNRIENLIDWQRAAEVAKRAEGIVQEVTAACNSSGGGAR